MAGIIYLFFARAVCMDALFGGAVLLVERWISTRGLGYRNWFAWCAYYP